MDWICNLRKMSYRRTQWTSYVSILSLRRQKKKKTATICNLFIFFHWTKKKKTDPPSQPMISGYSEGSIIPAGSVQKLMCISSGGNPLATLTWYKNDKRVSVKISLPSTPIRSAVIVTIVTINGDKPQREKKQQNKILFMLLRYR